MAMVSSTCSLLNEATFQPDDAKNNFYWQDYLGDIDYVRTAVAATRKGFADAGGNPEELKALHQ